ncbi:MAG: prephenate dehydratase [Bacteroidales bacterium]|jgi:prephenate dehydratase|nr:prephenate dehydratase [Bacteroidales bacterium]
MNQHIHIAIQGGYGSFHEIAARSIIFNSPITIVPCVTFNDLFDQLNEKKVDCALIAIENSLAGSLLPNFTLLRQSGAKIYYEKSLRIEQNLITLPCQILDEIFEIHSHPIALQQCTEFLDPLRKKGIKIIASDDTAQSAKWLREKRTKGIAVIASRLAAEIYRLSILVRNIETNRFNFTRFLLITKNDNVKNLEFITKQKINKASICFTLQNAIGSLAKILSILSDFRMNLSLVHSIPVIGTEWETWIYTDLNFDEYSSYLLALEAIRPFVIELNILGEYQNGK